jgi:hypothetical protein
VSLRTTSQLRWDVVKNKIIKMTFILQSSFVVDAVIMALVVAVVVVSAILAGDDKK